MKKRNITLLTAFAAAVALAPTAQATITATSELNGWGQTIDGDGNWSAPMPNIGGRFAGTLTIDNVGTANLVDVGGENAFFGGGHGATVTVTGAGAEFRATGGPRLGHQGTAEFNILDGGHGNFAHLYFYGWGEAYATVSGAGSKLTASTRVVLGWAPNGPGTPATTILTIEDGGLVQTDFLKISLDENGSNVGGYVHMGAGGILAVLGDKTGAGAFASGGLFTKHNAANVGEIQYDNGGTWENMTGATEGVDYTLEFVTTSTLINGQDVNGYTVLTMLDGTTPAADPEITSITVAGTTATITMKGTDGTPYTCKSSTTLADGFPTTETTDPISPIMTSGGTASFDVDAIEAKKFYRIAE